MKTRMLPGISPLIGRDTALGVLDRSLKAVAEGSGGCVVVEGPAGIGKSRVLKAAAAHATPTMAVAQGRATELDRVAPLTTMRTLLQASHPAGLQISTVEDLDRNRLCLVDRLGELIEDYVRAQPLVVLLDDAHWADELTALALRILIPALSSVPVLWLLARRPAAVRGPAQDAIDWLVGEGARRLHLDPLPDDAIAQLCAHVLGATPDSTVLSLAARSEGNPFLLEELLTAFRDTGQVLISEGTATLDADALPANFLGAVDHRLRDLSDEARRLLDAGSVLGRPFTVHEAAGLVGQSAIGLLPAASEAVDAGTLVSRGSALAFQHDLIREALYTGLPEPVRAALHREAASVVQAEGGSPVEIAEHLIRGACRRDGHAIAVLREAVQQVAPTAPQTAADLILRMLGLLEQHDASRPELVADAVRLLASAGRVTEAKELGKSALHTKLHIGAEAALLLGLSEALYVAGQTSAVVECTRRALGRHAVPEAVRAQLLAIRAHGLLDTRDIASADGAGAEAVTVGAAIGEHRSLVCGTAVRSVAARSRGDFDDALAYGREAVRIADDVGGEARHRQPRLWLGPALIAVDRFAEAEAVYERGQREADQLGTAWSQPHWYHCRAELRMAAGRLEDAGVEAEAGLRVAERLEIWAAGIPLLTVLARVAVYRDDIASARDHLDRAERLVAEGVSVGTDELAWTAALFQDAAGQPESALETLAELYAGLPQRLLLLSREPQAGPYLVRLAQRADAGAKAEAAAAAARSLAQRNPSVASLAGAAAHADGLLRDDLDALRAAVHHYRSSPRTLGGAAASEDAARAEAAAGQRSAAVALLEEAHDQYVTSGATRDAARARQGLRRLGVRRGSRQGKRDACTAWSNLTEAELRVVRLIAKGLTNREVASRLFLSPHTVSSHVRHSFTKLGVTSRVELTRQVLTHDRTEDRMNK